jgi:hypothetical protein
MIKDLQHSTKKLFHQEEFEGSRGQVMWKFEVAQTPVNNKGVTLGKGKECYNTSGVSGDVAESCLRFPSIIFFVLKKHHKLILLVYSGQMLVIASKPLFQIETL